MTASNSASKQDYRAGGRPSRLRLWRLGRNLTQEELRHLSGVSRARIGTLEQEKGLPRLSTAIALATVLGTTADEIWPELAPENGKAPLAGGASPREVPTAGAVSYARKA